MKRNAYFAISALQKERSTQTTLGPVRSRQASEDEGPTGLIQPAAPDPATCGHIAALQLEEPTLRLEPAGVTAQAAVRRKDAVAGHHDRDRIRTERLTRGARGLLAAGFRRDLRVRRDVAEADPRGGREDAPLEVRKCRHVDRDVERLALAGEVLIELARERIRALVVGQQARSIGAHDPRELDLRRLGAVVDGEQALRPDGDPERTERRVDDTVSDGLEPFALRARHKALPRVHHHLVHRIASLTFFIASATRDRAASSLHSRTRAISP